MTQIQEIPPLNIVLLVGPPGTGKSTFCQQAAVKSMAMDRPVIFVTTEYGPSRAEAALRERGLGKIEPGVLNFVDAYSETVGLSVSDRPDTVNASCADLSSVGIAISKVQDKIGRKGISLVFDSLTSPYLLSGSEVVRFMRLTLSRFAGEGNSVLVCFDEGSGKEEDLVAMMSLSSGVIKAKTKEDKWLLQVLKHPELRPTKIEVPAEPERAGLETRAFDPDALEQFVQAGWRRDEAFLRSELGDYVNLFWPNLAHWSGMLWDPKRFPMMTYEANKDDWPSMFKLSKEDEAIKRALFPRRVWLLIKLFMPKNFSKVKDMKKTDKFLDFFASMRVGVAEYLDDVSKTDEHYFRLHECSDCWGFENIGTVMASFIPPMIAGFSKGFEYWKGLDRDWNAVETKCIGLGDPYCELKVAPEEIGELRDSLEKDVPVIERIHERLMKRLMGFLLEGKPLMQSRVRLGNDINLHPVWHAMGGEGIPAMGVAWSERYRMALRMGGAKAGKTVGERLMEAGIGEGEAVKRVFDFLEHCKAGKVAVGETIRMSEGCESLWTKFYKKEFYRWEAPCCFFTTGFLNGFFSAVRNQHVKETKCIGMGDPYCEWEFM